MTDIHERRILILDFGSQYSQLIARRIREAGVYCELHPYTLSSQAIQEFAPAGIILSGGPATVTTHDTPRAPDKVFELGVPVLGICYGMQTMVAQLGGQVESAQEREFGQATITVTDNLPLFNVDTETLDVWMSHGDRVAILPEGFHVIAKTTNAPFAAIADPTRQFYGLQFHPEVTHTQQGTRILSHFAHDICGSGHLWTPSQIIDDTVTHIRETVGQDHVLLGLSGGVDSSVVAMLLHRAIGDQLHCVFVDTGLLRLNEAEQVMTMFAEHEGIHVIHVNASDDFFAALSGVDDPEEKRKISGRVFIEVFTRAANTLPNVQWLAQGTIYSDVIESAATQSKGGAAVIKSHHNVGGLPEYLPFKLLEPLRELFKDEVRELGLQLGLPHAMVHRHPFPGPGLVVRILGEVKPEYANMLRQADAIFIEELLRHKLYDAVAQAFVVFLPVKAVGVMGDARHYDYVVALRAVETVDFMTARWARLPHEFLAEVSRRIINEVHGITRVTYDISSKPPATIEWE